MEPEPFPLEGFCSEIQKALTSELSYLAAAGVLALPDVCSSLEWDPDPNKIKDQRRTQQDRYRDWFKEYVEPQYKHFTADDGYRLRCGLLHNGKLGRPQDQYDRIAFTVPPKRGPKEHLYRNNFVNGVNTGTLLALDLTQFCDLMIKGVREWYGRKSQDPFVQQNTLTLVRLNPEGIRPFFTGLPALVGDTQQFPDSNIPLTHFRG